MKSFFATLRRKSVGQSRFSVRFDLDALTEDECWGEFGFAKQDIPVLVEALQLPDAFHCEQ